ncbi:MAG TPA: pilus assembly protein PilM [candidate division Zixibacteria bacterium]|nr:pilus assembly protein PilM [candidate division Zixibacteria bacterium]
MARLSEKILNRLKGKHRPNSPDSASSPEHQFAEHQVKPNRRFFIGNRVAVQIDDHNICIAAARSNGLKASLSALKRIPISGEIATDELRDEFIAQTVSKFLRQHGIRSAEMCIALSGRETTFRTFSMPAMNSGELKSAISFEAKKQVPFPIDECLYDYRRTARVTTADRERDMIALQAATRRYVKQLIEPFRKQDLVVSQIHFAQEALGYLLPHLPGFNPEQTQAVITLAANRSDISFYRGTQLEFHRSGSVGSGDLGDTPDDYHLEMFVEALSGEVQTSFDFYSGQYGRPLSNRIFITGQIPAEDKIAALLTKSAGSEYTPLPVNQLSFLGNISDISNEELNCCIGAIAVATSNTTLGNLAPDKEKAIDQDRRTTYRARAATLVLAIILAFSWWFMTRDMQIAREELRQIESQLTHLRGTEAYVTYQILKRQVAASQEYVNQAKETPSHFYLNLKELTRLTPDNVYLSHLIFDSHAPVQSMIIEGSVLSGQIPPELTLAEFVERLAASPFYRDVKVERHIKRRQKDGFQIDFTLAMAGGI